MLLLLLLPLLVLLLLLLPIRAAFPWFVSPYPRLKGPHTRVHIPNSRGHTQSITCGLSVVFTVQANSNNNNSMSQSPIAKGLHGTAQQRHTIHTVPSGTQSTVRYNCHRTHGLFKAMYTTKTSAGSDNIVPGLSFKGGIFKEQRTTFV